MSYATKSHLLVADVANGGTFTVSYPAGMGQGDFVAGGPHLIETNRYGTLRAGAGASFSLGGSNVTITNNTGETLLAGTQMFVQLDKAGAERQFGMRLANTLKMASAALFTINLGMPTTADANGACASQSVSSGVPAVIDGALASGGVATFATPRNVVAAWTNTAVCTVTGTDEYGRVIRESSASGTSMTGVKAFKTITSVTFSANVTGATVGEGVLLGLPVYLPQAARIVKEIMDGATATAGTTVAGVRTKATATTGDVRGTYSPNSTPNGSRIYTLIVALDDPSDRGVPQFAG